MPLRRNLALHNDPVDNLIKRLPEDYRSILELPQDATATKNSLRLLATQRPVPSFGPHDRTETRAAVLLEYIVRTRAVATGSANTKMFKFKELGKVVGVKETTFKSLHECIGHYYHDQLKESTTNRNGAALTTKTSTQTSRNSKKRKQAPEQQQTQQRTKSRRGEISDNLLPSLAIRLASHLADPHGMARRARILFHQVRAHALAALPTAADRRGQEHDFCRYAAAYQAAALFHVATRTAPEESSYRGSNSSRAATLDDENAIRPLKLEDLVQACPACKILDLREKVACVERWAHELQKRQQPSSSQGFLFSKSKKSTTTTSGKTNSKKATGSATINNDTPETLEPTFDFAKWKESVLSPVLEHTRLAAAQESMDEPSSGTTTIIMERELLLQMASDTILAKYGLS